MIRRGELGLVQFLFHTSTTPNGNAYSLSPLSRYSRCVAGGRRSRTCRWPCVLSRLCAGGDQNVWRAAAPEDSVDAMTAPDIWTAIDRSTVKSAGRIDFISSHLSMSLLDWLRQFTDISSSLFERFRFRSDVTVLSVMTSPALDGGCRCPLLALRSSLSSENSIFSHA